MQRLLEFGDHPARAVVPFRTQLLKWIGSKQRFAHEIASYFPADYGTFFEPFLGSGAVLGTLAPRNAVASDVFKPLVEVWQTLQREPALVKTWYAARWRRMMAGDKVSEYEAIKAAYNANPNAADLLFLSRSCYGGVVRFRMADSHMSTPCGAHTPISPAAFSRRVDAWHLRTQGTAFRVADFGEALAQATEGDLVYCDPPYRDSQGILYGAQRFSLTRLFEVMRQCKSRGVYVALSIDGTKRSGDRVCDVPIPRRLFAREVSVNCGRSMLKRFQMQGKTLEREVVSDRLLLTY